VLQIRYILGKTFLPLVLVQSALRVVILGIVFVEEQIIIVLVLLIYDIISNAVSGREKRLGREHALDGSNACFVDFYSFIFRYHLFIW
jgi:hypothetical protein